MGITNAHNCASGISLLVIAAVFVLLYAKFVSTSGTAEFAVLRQPGAASDSAIPRYETRYVSRGAMPTVHSAAAVTVNDGIRAFWYAGNREGARNTVISTALFRPDATGWTDERALLTREDTQRALRRYIRKLGNPVAMRDPNGRLWLFYVSVSVGGWSGSAINLTVSDDDGRTWSVPHRLVTSPFFNVSTLVKGKPFLYQDGSIGLPVYHEFLGKFGELLRLDRKGRVVGKTRLSWGRHSLQPVIVTQSAMEATGFMRYCSKSVGRVLMFSTRDGGRTWSKPAKLAVPNPNAAVDAIALQKDDLLLVFNNREHSRDDLSLAFSPNNGRTWQTVHTFSALTLPADGDSAEFSYPWILRDRHGFHVLYTWMRLHIRHVQFDQDWLEQRL